MQSLGLPEPGRRLQLLLRAEAHPDSFIQELCLMMVPFPVAGWGVRGRAGVPLCVMYGNEEGAGRNVERPHERSEWTLCIKRSRG